MEDHVEGYCMNEGCSQPAKEVKLHNMGPHRWCGRCFDGEVLALRRAMDCRTTYDDMNDAFNQFWREKVQVLEERAAGLEETVRQLQEKLAIRSQKKSDVQRVHEAAARLGPKASPAEIAAASGVKPRMVRQTLRRARDASSSKGIKGVSGIPRIQ